MTIGAIVMVTATKLWSGIAVNSVSVTAVASDAEVQLSKRDFGLERDNIPSISGVYRQNPHCARDGGDKRTFSHSGFLLCRDTPERRQQKDRVFVRAATDI
jgi:hypothetical protein